MNTKDYLRASGYYSITEPYFLTEQQEIFERAVAQLRKGGRDFMVCEVEDQAEIFVWMPSPPEEEL